MRVTTERAEEIARGSPCWTDPVGYEKDEAADLAVDLLKVRKLLKDIQSLPPDDWSRAQISKTANSMIENYFNEQS